MDVNNIYDQSKLCVLRLEIIQAIYDIARPYSTPAEGVVQGVGFIISIDDGFVITTANIVANAITIAGYSEILGKRQLRLSLKSICPAKNIALCQIISEDINLLTRDFQGEDKKSFNVVFGDSLDLLPLEQLLTLTYRPNGETVTATLTYVSGFDIDRNKFECCEDAKARPPAHISLSTSETLMPGSPVFNGKSELVGLLSNSTGQVMIPSRTVLAIMEALQKEELVQVPTFGFGWNSTNRELIDLKTKDPSLYCIYIREVSPDSCCYELKEGDVLRQFIYYDPFTGSKDLLTRSLKLSAEYEKFNAKTHNLNKVICQFERYGQCYVNIETKAGIITLPRKLSLAEIVDMIPISCRIEFDLCREEVNNWCELTTFHNHVDNYRLPTCHPKLQPYDFEIFAGLLCMPLDTAHQVIFPDLNLDVNYRHTKALIIVKIFPHSLLSKTQSFQPGAILDQVNNQPTHSLRHIRTILRSKPLALTIKTKNKSFFVITLAQAIEDDKLSVQLFNLVHTPILLQK